MLFVSLYKVIYIVVLVSTIQLFIYIYIYIYILPLFWISFPFKLNIIFLWTFSHGNLVFRVCVVLPS